MKALLSSLLLAAPAGLLAVRGAPPCSDDATMGQVANAATAMLGSTAYVFPGDPCKGDKERFSCHYECDASLGAGAQWKAVRDVVSADRNVTQSITWVGPAAAGGALPNGTEVMFMVGGGTKQSPCPTGCPGFKPFVAYNPDPDVGLVELSSRGAPKVALATAEFIGHVFYVIGGIKKDDLNHDVYRFDTTTMRWIEPFRGAGAGGDTFTPRLGLSSAVIGNAIFTVGGVGTTPDGSNVYSQAVDILDLGRAGDAPANAVHVWHKGPNALTKRAYTAAFTMGCKVYVAGGATDGTGTGSAQNLKIVEIYSVPEGKTLAEGAWVQSSTPLTYPVSHPGAIVPAAKTPGQEAAVVIGGLSGGGEGQPKEYCQSVAQPCDDPSHTAHVQYSTVSCNPNQCAWGYVKNPAGE